MSSRTDGMTPFRETIIRFDVPESMVGENPFTMQRSGAEIALGGAERTVSTNVQLLASGAWVLTPLQENQSNIAENGDAANAVIEASGWNLASGMKSQARWRNPTELTGAGASGSVAATGNNFIAKYIAAGSSYASSDTADITAFGQPDVGGNFPMDRIAVAKISDPANQAYYLRFEVPGTKMHSPDIVYTYYFGQYCVVFSGDGVAGLYEKVDPTTPTVWTNRAIWRYCEPHRVCDTVHSMRILPHQSTTNLGYIEFRSSMTESAPPSSLVTKYFSQPTNPRIFLYQPPLRLTGEQTTTTVQTPRQDVRRPDKVKTQVSKLKYPASGLLVDFPFLVAFAGMGNIAFGSSLQPLTLSWEATIPDGCGLVGKLYDGATNAELTPVSSTDSTQTYSMNAGQSGYYAQFEFSSDQNSTPFLWSYEVKKDGIIITSSVTEFGLPAEVDGNLRQSAIANLSITGAENDPSHETGSIDIDDYTNALGSTLGNRSSIRTRIKTEYDNAGNTSVLLDGYLERATASRKGSLGSVFPSQDWRQYSCTFMGVWKRLMESLTFFRKTLAVDKSASTDKESVGYRVTDTIQLLFNYAGFDNTMLDIPVSSIRFFPTPTMSGEELMIEPLMSCGELITRWAREYLGGYIIWDANAGSAGMWRLRYPPTSPYTNLWTFTTDAPAGKVVSRPESYGTTNWVANNGTSFIVKGSLHTYVKAPEFNAVFVCGAGDTLNNKWGQLKVSNYVINYDSLNNPSSPDFVGRLIPLVVVDTGISNQDQVDFFCRRYYQFGAHAMKMASFQSPLPLITDPSDSYLTNPRPLRYYDPVTITSNGVDGQWLIRNCNISVKKDTLQLADFEAQVPNF